MNKGCAIILTIFLISFGVIVATKLAQTQVGETIINLTNLFSFILGIVYVVTGSRSKNILQIGAGIFLISLAVGSTGLPEPLEAGVQLFMAVAGLFIKLPTSQD